MFFERARNDIYKNTRPLDLARWMFLFEDGSTEKFLKAICA